QNCEVEDVGIRSDSKSTALPNALRHPDKQRWDRTDLPAGDCLCKSQDAGFRPFGTWEIDGVMPFRLPLNIIQEFHHSSRGGPVRDRRLSQMTEKLLANLHVSVSGTITNC